MLFKKLIHLLVITFLFLSQNAFSAVILQYHHVSEKLPSITSVSAHDFYTHMAYLRSESFHVIPLDELLEKIKHGEPLPPKTVAITFDDGYKNNIEQAAPILESFGYPYTVFVNPKLIDEKKPYVMTWQQLKKLSEKGALIANHSSVHDYLHHKLEAETDAQWSLRIERDIIWSEKRISEEIGHNAKILAYPYGEFNKSLQALVNKLKFNIFAVYLDSFCGGLFSVALLGLYLQASCSVQREKMAGSKHHGWKMWQIAGLLHAFAWFIFFAVLAFSYPMHVYLLSIMVFVLAGTCKSIQDTL